MNNTTEEKNTQNCTPDEACCCDTAAEQAPVTQEELNKAIDHLLDLVGRYKGCVVVAAFVKGDDKTRRAFRSSKDVFASEGEDFEVCAWAGACGYFVKAKECFDCNAKTIGEGIRFFIEFQQKEKMKARMNPIAAMLGIAGCECEECED